MDYHETHNDLYDVDVKDETFSLLAKLDEEVKVKVKTPCGKTDQFTLNNIVMQGTVWGPIKCSTQMGTLSRDAL